VPEVPEVPEGRELSVDTGRALALPGMDPRLIGGANRGEESAMWVKAALKAVLALWRRRNRKRRTGT
jgi:hypothetical protein